MFTIAQTRWCFIQKWKTLQFRVILLLGRRSLPTVKSLRAEPEFAR